MTQGCFPRRPMEYEYRYRELPPVNPATLGQSAHSFQPLLQDASRIVARLSDRSFATTLMTAAQAGRQEEVDRLMNTAVSGSRVQTRYTPSGVVITIEPPDEASTCCRLSMTLKWGA
ncbi:hypothetical protein [Paenibacillus xylaniclasticus]|uniref:hypothetical protein n=1 Tax=Paenibacillus xylaniclasticus TaxID=588083 RepID=UPI000FDB91D7|nr:MULTISPECIES: hypothetical protein [Paenibacillus]